GTNESKKYALKQSLQISHFLLICVSVPRLQSDLHVQLFKNKTVPHTPYTHQGLAYKKQVYYLIIDAQLSESAYNLQGQNVCYSCITEIASVNLSTINESNSLPPFDNYRTLINDKRDSISPSLLSILTIIRVGFTSF